MDQPSRASVGSRCRARVRARGGGEPVVLIHNGPGADWFEALARQPELADEYQLLLYHRAGFAGSGPRAGAPHIRHRGLAMPVVMAALGIERAHIVGHSSSGMIALQLALDAPEAVQSLLARIRRPAPRTEAQAEFVARVVGPAMARYGEGDIPGAVDTWMQGVCGPGYRPVLEAAIPGALRPPSPTPSRSSARSSPRSRAGRSPSRTRDGSRTRRSPSWGGLRRAGLRRASATCCSPGCRTPSPSTSPTRPIFSASRTPAGPRRAWRASSPATRSPDQPKIAPSASTTREDVGSIRVAVRVEVGNRDPEQAGARASGRASATSSSQSSPWVCG